MAARYWVGGTGNWNGTAGSKWATTSGGAGGAAVPTAADDVFIDAASGAVTVTISAVATCRNFDCTGFTGTFAGTNGWTVSGNFTLVSGMTYSNTSTITFDATSGTQAITTAGHTIGGNFTFNGVGGTWQLQDHLTIVTGKTITLTNGSLDLNAKNITVGNMVSNNSNVRTLNITNCTITLNNTGSTWNFNTTTNLTLTTTGSTIIISDATTTAKNFAGGGKTYNILTVSGDNVIISGANTFTTININNAGLTTGLVLTSGVTQTVTNLSSNGSIGNLTKLVSSSAGSAATISKSSGTVTLNYMSIKDSTATGGATFRAPLSTNVSGNTGWLFDLSLSISAASFAVTGNATGLYLGRKVVADVAAFTLSGNATGLLATRQLSISTASYLFTGNATALNKGFSLSANAAQYVFTGIATGLYKSFNLSCNAAQYLFTGLATGVYATRNMAAAVANYILTGQNVTPKAVRALAGAAAAYTLTGNNAELTYTGGVTTTGGNFLAYM